MSNTVLEFFTSHFYSSLSAIALAAVLVVTFIISSLPSTKKRKKAKRIRKQMSKHATSSSQQLLDQLFDTQQENWLSTSDKMINRMVHYKEDAIIFFPFPTKTKTYFAFTDVSTKNAPSWSLTLYIQQTKLLTIHYLPEQSQYTLTNFIDDTIDESLNQLKFKNLFSRLITFYALHYQNDEFPTVAAKRRSEEWFQEKEILLRQALTSSHFWETKALDDFRLDVEDKNFTKRAVLYFQDKPLFTGNYEDYSFNYSFLNENSSFFRIVEHSYDALERYFKEGLSGSYSQKKLVARSLGNVTISQLEQNIQTLLLALQKEAKWLSDHNRDRVIRTLPKETSSLLSLYTQASDPATVEEHVASSFKNIIRSLKMMEYEAGNNKQRAHLQQSHNIEAKE